MIYSCKYEKETGKILEWCKGATLKAALGLKQTYRTVGQQGDYGVVAQYPIEVDQNDGLWAMEHLKVSVVHENGTVEVSNG